jgi:hypothetical protein
MKRNPWPDFFFTVVVRFIGGALMGGLACVVIGHRALLRSLAHDNMQTPILWLAAAGTVGGLAGAFTTPYWETPWYKGIRDRDDEDT